MRRPDHVWTGEELTRESCDQYRAGLEYLEIADLAMVHQPSRRGFFLYHALCCFRDSGDAAMVDNVQRLIDDEYDSAED